MITLGDELVARQHRRRRQRLNRLLADAAIILAGWAAIAWWFAA